MRMKKVLAALLGVLMVFTVTACGSDAGWLPYGLEFGQSYEDFCAVLVENGIREPALKPASSNNGYLTDIIYENGNVLEWDFLHSETLTSFANCEDAFQRIDYSMSSPAIAFSFNQNKELYEMYCLFEDTDYLDFSETIGAEIIAYFDEQFDSEERMSDAEQKLNVQWKNENIVIETRKTEDKFLVILHNYTHDLDSYQK